MPFTLSQLVIAALVVAAVVGLFLVARHKRSAKVAPPQSAPAEPAPPEPVRRRQLQSFVDTEWDTAPEPLPEAVPTFAPEPEPAPEAAPTLAPEPEPIAQQSFAEPEPAFAPSSPPQIAYESDQPDYDQAVLGRLEEAFEALQAGALSLEAYREQILAEAAEVDRRVAELEFAGDGPELQAALVAQESVRWCLDWANDQGESGAD